LPPPIWTLIFRGGEDAASARRALRR